MKANEMPERIYIFDYNDAMVTPMEGDTVYVSEDEIEKKFKAGDVVVYVSRQPAYSGLYLLGNPNDLSIGYSNANEPYQIALRNCTVASEDERKQFMRELESNGYEWNENTLRIEKVEPVSEELEEAVNAYIGYAPEVDECSSVYGKRQAFKAGAKWQKTKNESTTEGLGEYISELSKQFPEVSFAKLSRIAVRVAKWQKEHLWKPADGDDLPEINKEVIALIEAFGHYKVIFAHRVDENAEIHTSIDGKPLVLHPKRYNKGGWNIPVVYWLDVELPKEIEL